MELKAEILLPGGPANGRCLALTAPISFWGGVDPATGTIIDARHPQHGRNVAGTILILIIDVTPQIGPAYTFLAFIIVITGGLGSMPGALLGGVLIGLTEALAGLFFAPSAKSMFSFAILVAVRIGTAFGKSVVWSIFLMVIFPTIGLLILGYHLGAKVSKGMATGVVVGLWLLWVLVKVGLAGLGGA